MSIQNLRLDGTKEANLLNISGKECKGHTLEHDQNVTEKMTKKQRVR